MLPSNVNSGHGNGTKSNHGKDVITMEKRIRLYCILHTRKICNTRELKLPSSVPTYLAWLERGTSCSFNWRGDEIDVSSYFLKFA